MLALHKAPSVLLSNSCGLVVYLRALLYEYAVLFFITESPGHGFEAASPQILRGEGLPRFSLPQTPLMWEPPALGLLSLWTSFR